MQVTGQIAKPKNLDRCTRAAAATARTFKAGTGRRTWFASAAGLTSSAGRKTVAHSGRASREATTNEKARGGGPCGSAMWSDLRRAEA